MPTPAAIHAFQHLSANSITSNPDEMERAKLQLDHLIDHLVDWQIEDPDIQQYLLELIETLKLVSQHPKKAQEYCRVFTKDLRRKRNFFLEEIEDANAD